MINASAARVYRGVSHSPHHDLPQNRVPHVSLLRHGIQPCPSQSACPRNNPTATTLQIPNVDAPIPTLQTIFHAFTQQNRMSTPQTHQKSHNPMTINKIKVSPKRFLVMVNQVK
jgi:hypothetical protein